jgi:putative ABC transport system permease protein
VSRNGGLPARRAVVRWAWRLFRREWRQQVMVLTLLTVAVTAAVVGVSAGYHATAPGTARFGAASQWFKLYADEERPLDPRIAQAREWFGTIDVVGHWYLPVPGSVETVELRAQDPRGPYGGPMLRLLTGRYPTAPGEAAVTDEVAADLRVHVGGVLTLDGRTWTVVGLVENPGDLRAEFILVAPARPEQPESVTVLTAADPARFAEYRAQHGQPVYELRPSNQWVEAAAGVFSVFAVSMLLVCLIATAGFAVVAHRRLRQLGLLAAVGATPRHLRLVLLVDGAAVGGAASVVGAAVGVLVWFAVTPRFETAAGHRIDWLDLPWWQIAVAVLVAILTATAAAWRPARAAAQVPITLALSSRPPRPKRVRRSALAAAVLIVLGIVSLRLAQRNAAMRDALEIAEVALIVAGTLAIGFALLFVGPLAIRVLAAIGARLPVAPRLALRDLARHQARSSAALAAISVALAIPAATVVAARVLEQTAAEGNLSDRQLLIWVDLPGLRVPDRAPAQLAAIEAQVRRYTATLADPAVIPLEIAVDPAEAPHADADGGRIGRTPVGVGRQTGPDSITVSGAVPLVGTPELLRYYGVDSASIGQTTDVLTVQPRSDLVLLSESGATARSLPRATTERLPNPQFESLPTTFLTPAALQRNNWRSVRTGWLIEAPRPLTEKQLAGARELALDAGLVVEDRNKRGGLLALRAIATAAGALLALAILAMTVGLIRAEAAGDLRTLTATGATGHIRRTLTSATAGGLALLGGILGIGAAYTVIVAGSSRNQLDELARVPVVELLVIAVGVPLVAAALGWLLAGREPRSLVRVRLE